MVWFLFNVKHFLSQSKTERGRRRKKRTHLHTLYPHAGTHANNRFINLSRQSDYNNGSVFLSKFLFVYLFPFHGKENQTHSPSPHPLLSLAHRGGARYFIFFNLSYSRSCSRTRSLCCAALFIPCVDSICLSQFLGMFDGSFSFSGRSAILHIHSLRNFVCLKHSFSLASVSSLIPFLCISICPLFVHLLFRLIFVPFFIGLRHSFMPFKCL